MKALHSTSLLTMLDTRSIELLNLKNTATGIPVLFYQGKLAPGFGQTVEHARGVPMPKKQVQNLGKREAEPERALKGLSFAF